MQPFIPLIAGVAKNRIIQFPPEAFLCGVQSSRSVTFAGRKKQRRITLSSVDLDTVLHHILLIVRNYFGISNCAVMLVDASSNEL